MTSNITDQIELAAWEHELRGPDGKWISGLGSNHPDVQKLRAVAPRVQEYMRETSMSGRTGTLGMWHPGEKGAPHVLKPQEGSEGDTSIVTLPDGSSVIHKDQDKLLNDREELAYYVSQAIGAGMPAVHRISDREIIEQYVDGMTGTRLLANLEPGSLARYTAENRIYKTSGGRKIALLDMLTNNSDRHTSNWMVAHGQPVPIDMGHSNFDGGDGARYYSDFVKYAEDQGGGWDEEELERAESNLRKIQPEFNRMNHLAWYADMMRQLYKLQGKEMTTDDYRKFRYGYSTSELANAWEHELRGPDGEWVELYHGTTADKVASIRAKGLEADRYSKANRVLTSRKDEAGYFASLNPRKRSAVVTVRIPTAQLDEYTEGTPGLRSLRKPLPPSMIHQIDEFANISDQVIALVNVPAWQRELRAPDGRWIKGGLNFNMRTIGRHDPKPGDLAWVGADEAGNRVVGRVVERIGSTIALDMDDRHRWVIDLDKNQVLRRIPLSQVPNQRPLDQPEPAYTPPAGYTNLKITLDPHPPNKAFPYKVINDDEVEWHVNAREAARLRAISTGIDPTYRPPAEPAPFGRYSKANQDLRAKIPELRKVMQRWAESSAGPSPVEWLGEGNEGATAIVTLPDGSKVISKGQDSTANDREELASYVAQVIGAPHPTIVRQPGAGRDIIETYQQGVPGSRYLSKKLENETYGSAAYFDKYDQEMHRIRTTPEGRKIGLLDALTANSDRHDYNWLVGPDGKPISVDLGHANFDSSNYSSPFMPTDGMGNPVLPSVSTQDYNRYWDDLMKLQPEFARLGHPDWFANMMWTLAKLGGKPLTPEKYNELYYDTGDVKLAYNPLEPRNAHGEWTKGPGLGYLKPDHSRLVNPKARLYPDPADHPFFKQHPVTAASVIKSWDQASPQQQIQGMRWYHDAHDIAGKIADGDYHKGAGLLAAYSPQTGWAVNMFNAAQAAAQHRALGPGDGMITGDMQANAQDALDGLGFDEAFPSPKIKSFAKLIYNAGDADEDRLGRVVIDRHALSVAMGTRLSKKDADHAPLKTDRYYEHVADAYREAAIELSQREGHTISPYQVQAVTWLVQQAKNEGADAEAATEKQNRLQRGRVTATRNAWERWQAYAKKAGIPVEHGTTALANLVWQVTELAAWEEELLLPHAEVEFEHPAKGPHHCSECVHWLGARCEIVEPPVEAGDWCNRWTAGAVALSITEQLDLSWRDAWMHETRDSHGRWTRDLEAPAAPAGRERVTGWHFDPQDTPQQRHTLRTHRTSQLVRRDFPAGTRVRARASSEMGTVQRHVPGLNAQGGYLLVKWDRNGVVGRHGAIGLERVGEPAETAPIDKLWDEIDKESLNARDLGYRSIANSLKDAGSALAERKVLLAERYMKDAVMLAKDAGMTKMATRYQGFASRIHKLPISGEKINSMDIIREWRKAKDRDVLQHLNLAGAHMDDDNAVGAAFELGQAARVARERGLASDARNYERLADAILSQNTEAKTTLETTRDFTAKMAPAMPGLLGGGREAWNGHTQIFDDGENPGVAGELTWAGNMNIQHTTAEQLRTILEGGPGQLVSDPTSLSVILHELIHGVIGGSEGTDEEIRQRRRAMGVEESLPIRRETYRDHEAAYQDPNIGAVEEGFTELGTIQHMPEFVRQAGLGDRPTDMLAVENGHAVDNPQFTSAVQGFADKIATKLDELMKDQRAPYQHAAQSLAAYLDDLRSDAYSIKYGTDDGYHPDAITEVQHLGDPALTQWAKSMTSERRHIDMDIMPSRQATLAEYADRLNDPQRIYGGNAWGHYGWQTKQAQDWVRQVAMAEGHKDVTKGTPGARRVRELTDEINREGPAHKVRTMARQLVRASGVKPDEEGNVMSQGDWGALEEAIAGHWFDPTEQIGAISAFLNAQKQVKAAQAATAARAELGQPEMSALIGWANSYATLHSGGWATLEEVNPFDATVNQAVTDSLVAMGYLERRVHDGLVQYRVTDKGRLASR